jgi:DNA-binding MarR family transcriptional regulator
MSITTPDPAPAPGRVVPPLPEELVASTTFLLKRLGFAAKDRALAAYEREGVHPYHFAILIALDQGEHETQGAIADVLGYDRGQLVGLLDELEEKRLVERRRDPNDRRRHLVHLTADGKRVLRRLRTCAREIENDFLAPLGESERADLHALLLRLAEKHEPRCAALEQR